MTPIFMFNWSDITSYSDLIATGLLVLLLARTNLFNKIIEIVKNSGDLLEKSNNTLKERITNLEKELAEQKHTCQMLLRELDMRKSMSAEDRAVIENLEEKLTDTKKELAEAYDRVSKKGGVK